MMRKIENDTKKTADGDTSSATDGASPLENGAQKLGDGKTQEMQNDLNQQKENIALVTPKLLSPEEMKVPVSF